MIAHLETSSIVGLAEGPLLYLVEIKKKHQKGKGSTFPGLMQMAVQDFFSPRQLKKKEEN